MTTALHTTSTCLALTSTAPKCALACGITSGNGTGDGPRHNCMTFSRMNETPIAVIVPADPAAPPTLDDLAAWARGKLASYKKPTGLVVVDQLPRNAAGKVLKHELRVRYGAAGTR